MPSCKKCCPVHLWPLPTSPSKNSETSYTSYCSPPLPPNSHISNYLLVPTTVTNCPAYNKCHHTCLPASGRGLAWTNLTPAHNAAPLDSAWNSSRCHFISTGSAEEVLRNCPYPHIRLSGLQQPCYNRTCLSNTTWHTTTLYGSHRTKPVLHTLDHSCTPIRNTANPLPSADQSTLLLVSLSCLYSLLHRGWEKHRANPGRWCPRKGQGTGGGTGLQLGCAFKHSQSSSALTLPPRE